MKSMLVANQTMRNESEYLDGGRCEKGACTFSGNSIFLKILSKIRTVSTRKMMSYARIG